MSDEIRGIITLNHSDGVSGTTIMSDGTKAFWSEGRSADVNMLRPDGEWEEASAGDPIHRGIEHPIWTLLNDDDVEKAYGVHRAMTECEEHEHNVARNGFIRTFRDWRVK